jgi:multiple sugar transport system permease protein
MTPTTPSAGPRLAEAQLPRARRFLKRDRGRRASGVADPQDRWLPYALTTPVVVAVSILVFLPLLLGLLTSFTDAALPSLDQVTSGVTFENYTALLGDSGFWNSVRATAIYSLGGVGGGLLVGLATALVLNADFRGRGVARTLLILPWAVPYVVTALLWVWMYNPQYGVLNYFLLGIPFVDARVQWLTDPSLAMLAVILVTVWKTYPFAALMFLAGLQSISQDLYEAAEIDGAGRVRQFFDITLPSLRSVSYVVILLLTIWSFGNFVLIFLMTSGGPAGATETLVVRVYQEAFRFFDAGSAFAMGTVLLGFALVFTAAYALMVRQVQDG